MKLNPLSFSVFGRITRDGPLTSVSSWCDLC
uniref:Uncharacterized protein n=1 Tax=Rhizophora mucronata TaxID=61149 RepID=A0A2P2QZS1_RHIMU